MAAFRRAVVVALLAIWSFPAVSVARPAPAGPAPLPEVATAAATPPSQTLARTGGGSSAEAAKLGTREKQARDLEDWRGGGNVFFYVGSGLLLVLIVVLLLVLI